MTVYAVFASVLCGLIAPFYYYDVILLYQLSAYRLNELFTAVKRKKYCILYLFLPFLPYCSRLRPRFTLFFVRLLFTGLFCLFCLLRQEWLSFLIKKQK